MQRTGVVPETPATRTFVKNEENLFLLQEGILQKNLLFL